MRRSLYVFAALLMLLGTATAQESVVINTTWIANGFDSPFDAEQAADRAALELGSGNVATVTATNGKHIVLMRVNGTPGWLEEPPIMTAQFTTPEAAMEEYAKHEHSGCRGMMSMHDKVMVVYWSKD